jgi:hypothetical protein
MGIRGGQLNMESLSSPDFDFVVEMCHATAEKHRRVHPISACPGGKLRHLGFLCVLKKWVLTTTRIAAQFSDKVGIAEYTRTGKEE